MSMLEVEPIKPIDELMPDNVAPPVRAAVYVAAVVLLVVFGPWTSKSFIYFQF
jgi:hypothetical protein